MNFVELRNHLIKLYPDLDLIFVKKGDCTYFRTPEDKTFDPLKLRAIQNTLQELKINSVTEDGRMLFIFPDRLLRINEASLSRYETHLEEITWLKSLEEIIKKSLPEFETQYCAMHVKNSTETRLQIFGPTDMLKFFQKALEKLNIKSEFCHQPEFLFNRIMIRPTTEFKIDTNKLSIQLKAIFDSYRYVSNIYGLFVKCSIFEKQNFEASPNSHIITHNY